MLRRMLEVDLSEPSVFVRSLLWGENCITTVF